MPFCLRNSVNTARRHRVAILIFVCAFLALSFTTPALAQFRNKKAKTPAATPPAEKLPAGMQMSKTQAVAALIQALTVNQSPQALETLEQIVLGKMSFGGHSKQAAETALVALAMRRQSPDASAFLLKLVSEPDDKLRAGDTDYPAAAVRYDAARVGCRVGSPELRVGLANLHGRVAPEIRTVIETTLGTPSAANLSAQLVLVRSPSVPDFFKTTLQKLILDQNAIALKQALRIEESPAQDASAMAPGGSPGAVPVLPLGAPTQPSTPAAAAAAAIGVQNPVWVILDVTEKTINAKPADPAVVARELWQNEFVEALSTLLSSQKTVSQPTLTAVASIPLKNARERLRDYLLQKSPRELGVQQQPAAAPGAAKGKGMGGGMAGGAGRGGRSMGAQGAQSAMYAVGTDWLDPGALVVLKTLSYKDRVKTKHRTPPAGPGTKRTPAAEKRAEELAERDKQTEIQYEWRDTIEKFVSHWDDRLSAVAEVSDAAATDKDAAADKEKAGSTKSTKTTDAASKKSTRIADKRDAGDSKAKGGAGPTPSVPLPFALRPGEKITKEFHLRWPEGLPANLTAAVSEPLIVHYVQLEGTDDPNRTATFYRSSLAKGTGPRPHSETHDIESGKWVDILQRDFTHQRTRSLDILVTRQPPDPDAKKSKIEALTIQVLMVEVESFEPEPKQTDKKEQAKSDSP
jgi:hypothetical protein